MGQQNEWCFANKDGCSIKWNNTIKVLEILLKLDHIVKGNKIAEVWVGPGTYFLQGYRSECIQVTLFSSLQSTNFFYYSPSKEILGKDHHLLILHGHYAFANKNSRRSPQTLLGEFYMCTYLEYHHWTCKICPYISPRIGRHCDFQNLQTESTCLVHICKNDHKMS